MESTLSLAKADLDLEVGDFAGFGPSPWTDRQQSQIDRAVKAGMRSVYFTQEVMSRDGKLLIEGGYDWSFLKPVAEITLAEDANTVDLPDDFGGVLGRVIPATAGVGAVFPIPYVGEGQMYQLETLNSSATGRPLYALVEQIKGTTPTHGTRSRLRFYPTADQEYTAKIWYTILPDALTDARPYVLGGSQHAETFKAAVRAAYEQDFDGMMGSETAKFTERLKASIAMDRKMKPTALGRNRDSSDDYGWTYGGHYGTFGFDVSGVTPSVWSAY